jgi:hypothetical protein
MDKRIIAGIAVIFLAAVAFLLSQPSTIETPRQPVNYTPTKPPVIDPCAGVKCSDICLDGILFKSEGCVAAPTGGAVCQGGEEVKCPAGCANATTCR